MAGTIATLLTAPKTININDESNRGPQRHVYEELVGIQSRHDPTLASPYVAADAVSTIAANGGASGNLTITIAFPAYGVEVTTGNIINNAADTVVQTAVDAALAGETILSSYTADDVKVVGTNMSANAVSLTANGAAVAKTNMVVTTANAGDLDVTAPAVAATTIGTVNRPSEAVLAEYGVVTPASGIIGRGSGPAASDFAAGVNPFSISPGTKEALVNEISAQGDPALATVFREVIGCV
jgi:hypothetical protein